MIPPGCTRWIKASASRLTAAEDPMCDGHFCPVPSVTVGDPSDLRSVYPDGNLYIEVSGNLQHKYYMRIESEPSAMHAVSQFSNFNEHV